MGRGVEVWVSVWVWMCRGVQGWSLQYTPYLELQPWLQSCT